MDELYSGESGQLISPIWPDETEQLLHVIDEGLSGKIRNIAIISEYLAGREEPISKIEDAHAGRIKHITLTETQNDLSILSNNTDADIIIVENCRFIFHRMINGFHLLDEFIEILSRKEKIWITTWNIHTWRYLIAVKDIGSLFGKQIELKRKSEPDIKKIILSQQLSSIFYIVDPPVPRRMVLIQKQKSYIIPIINKTIGFTYYSLRWRLFVAILRNKSQELEPSELIFERLHQISNGNPGVALHIWQEASDAWEIRLSSLTPPTLPAISDPDTAYILSLIMSYEEVQIPDLKQALPSDINLNLIISKLRDKELVVLKNEKIRINPIALAEITKELKRIRMVW
ncbi:hypothetical protein [Methanospirillum lacunae]|uniref:Uncharacterized protein n=1 Tax=Methanospirillum lacunae TaxID=668570 RepID=A0A2V2MW06_9EURY|nr:hypothetical protein [Methanospirillum lacunae]PWR70425.1 hypothetical protein DK846_14780 [Methanospirillum lacunae]